MDWYFDLSYNCFDIQQLMNNNEFGFLHILSFHVCHVVTSANRYDSFVEKRGVTDWNDFRDYVSMYDGHYNGFSNRSYRPHRKGSKEKHSSGRT